MKNILLILFSLYSINAYSQSDFFFGDYTLIIKTENASFKYNLILQPNGIFTFHLNQNISEALAPETNKFGKGTWTSEKNIITFFANSNTDFNEKYSLDFNNSKARFISKSPRDKSDKIVKTRLQFYKTNIRWIEGKELFKQ